MGDWDEIQCDFNQLDETIVFGTRRLAGLDNLYEATTLACIKNSNSDPTETPVIQSVIVNGSVYFSINKTLRVFENLSLSSLLFSATFDETVDTFCTAQDGSLVLVCFRDGTVTLLRIGEACESLYDTTIFQNVDLENKFFITVTCETESTGIIFYLVSKNGMAHRLTCPFEINSAANEEEFKVDVIIDLRMSLQYAFFKFPTFFYSDSECTVLYDVADKEIISQEIGHFRKIYQYTSTVYIGLNEIGELISVCTKTGLISYVHIGTLFDDVILISNKTSVFILGRTKTDELGTSNVQLFSCEANAVVFSIKISETIHFVIPEHIDDEIMYIAEINNNQCTTELRFQTISETIPEARLQRLLRRGKFEEAEKFAKLFNLDVTEIQKAKVQAIVDQLVCTEDDIRNFINILEVVKDDNFKIVSCLDIHLSCSSLKDVETVLRYMNSIPVSSTCEDIENLQNDAFELWVRFHTFTMLVRTNPSRDSVKRWNSFSQCNLIDEMHTSLQLGNREEFIIIYSRLDHDSLDSLCDEDVSRILNILKEIPLNDQIIVLNTFIPLTLKYLPSTANLFINWMISKVDSIEKLDFKNFPENALDFLYKTSKLLQIEDPIKVIFHEQTKIDFNQPKKLDDLIKTLEKIKSLKVDHCVVIPFQQIFQGPEYLAQALLSILNYDFLNEKFFEDFIEKFILSSSLNIDQVLSDIIEDVVKYEEDHWIKIVLLALKYINSLDKKLAATLIILQAAKLPWCQEIRDVAVNSLKHSHHLVQSIREQIEEEPRNCVFQKYIINRNVNNNMQFLKFAAHRIIYCNEPTMVDDIYLICSNSKERASLEPLLLKHFIDAGDFRTALKVLNNSKENLAKCIKLVMMDSVFEKESHYLENLFRFIGSAKFEDGFEKLHYKSTIDDLKCIFFVQKRFNINMTLREYYRQSKFNILQQLVSIVTEECDDSFDVAHCIRTAEEIASHLRLDSSYVLYEMSKRIADFNLILSFARTVFETNDSNMLYKAVVLILTHIGSPEMNLNVSHMQSLCDYSNIEIQPFVCALKLASKMIVKAIINANWNLSNCLKLGNWIAVTLVQSKMDDDIIETDKELILPRVSVFNGIRSTFNFYRNLTLTLQPTDDTSVPLVTDQVLAEIRYLQSTISELISEGNTLLAYKLIQTLYRSLTIHSNTSNDLHDRLYCILKFAVDQFIKYIFSSPEIDVNLTVNLLVISNEPANSKRLLLNNLKRYVRNINKLEKIAEICRTYLQYCDINDGQSLCTNVLCLVKWWKRLKKCHISYEEFFKHPPNVILIKLIQSNDLSTDMICDFCTNIDADVQSHYKMYLEYLLLNWKPNYTVSTNVYGKECITMNHNHENYVEECVKAVELIEDKKLVFRLLDSVWTRINFYHYEAFMCVLDILSVLNSENFNKQNKFLLLFLNGYNRISAPGEAEREQWFTSYPDTQCIDPLSKWRVPFTPTLLSSEIWSILRPEINLTTYKEWFNVISVLRHLTVDDICSYVIKDVVTSGILHSEKSDSWLTQRKYEDFLHAIDVCVANITNSEQATSALYSLLSHIPKGLDLVKAAELCYKYALKYQQENPNSVDVKKAVIKIHKKYIHFSAIHILHVNELAEKMYLDMISGTVDDIIEALYMDKRIVQSVENVGILCPDINKAVGQLCVLYDIDVKQKKKELLNNWLTVDYIGNSLNQSLPNKYEFKNTTPKDYLIRAMYLCRTDDVKYWQSYLLSLNDGDENGSKQLKAAALKCLDHISDSETIEDLTGFKYKEFRCYLNKLSLISELENFGFCHSIDTLDAQNKSQLLNRLSYHISNTSAVKIMAFICFTYSIYEAKYWKIILTSMVKLKMFQEAKESVQFLNRNVSLYNCEWYINAWQQLINYSFLSKPNVDKDYLRKLYIQGFFLIQSCSVLFSLKLNFVVEQCLLTGQYDLILVAIQYLSADLQQDYLKELIKRHVCIEEKLEQLDNLGFWGLKYVKQVVAEFMRQNETYEQ